MIVKKYIVDDMKEAMVRARYELGREAIIISQRNIKVGKWYNPFKQKKIEVTVALEEDVRSKDVSEPVKKAVEKVEKVALEEEEQVNGEMPKEDEEKEQALTLDEFRESVIDRFKGNPFEKKEELDRINVFIGPTGVGKTTTIAKLAAREHLQNKKRVGLMTMDTYRIGAVEQLKTYAEIIGLPFEVINESDEIEEKLDKLSYCDRIFIDTLGTSPNDQAKIDEIKGYLKKIDKRIRIYLTISMSIDAETLLFILDKYNVLHYDAIILTKFDETNHLDNLWRVLENSSFPVQFICHGQNVPDDVQRATLENVFTLVKEKKQ